jgi:hypothetical protein
MTADTFRISTVPETALAAPLMLGYWPEHSVCLVVVDADGQVLLIMRWHVAAPEVPPHLPLTDIADAAAFHIAVFAEGPDGAAAPWRQIAADIAARGIPVGRRLFVYQQGDDVMVSVDDTSGEGVSVPLRLSREHAACIAASWRVPMWSGSREDYVSDIALDTEREKEVVAALDAKPPLRTVDPDRLISEIYGSLLEGALDANVMADVIVGLHDVRVRDTVLWELMRAPASSWCRAADSLANTVAASPRHLVAPAATVLSILRWQIGDGSRAGAAVELALEGDPAYSLADLVNRCLLAGMHPAVWREGLADLSREACRRSA